METKQTEEQNLPTGSCSYAGTEGTKGQSGCNPNMSVELMGIKKYKTKLVKGKFPRPRNT